MHVKDFNKWDLQPRILTDDEIADPMMVINEVFDYAHLPDLRNVLWEWLKTTVSGNFNKKSLHYKDRESLMEFYERMQKLLEAAHLLLLAKKLAVPGIKDTSTIIANDRSHSTQGDAPAAEILPIIEQLVGPLSPDFIFEMCKIQERGNLPPTYYFLVVLPNTEQRTYAACQALVETTCSNNGTVQLITVKTGELERYLQQGHLLYSYHCTEQYLVYAKDHKPIPLADTSRIQELISIGIAFFNAVLAKAQAFYDGAIFYLSQSNYALAVFMLQQAAEHTLRGFLHAVTGRNNVSHDLVVLRRYALPFIQELVHILPVEADKETCLLNKAGKAYVQARYENSFIMPVTEISQLKDWVEKLLPQTKQAFDQRMENILTAMCVQGPKHISSFD